MKKILYGGTGTGKTENLIKEYKKMVEDENIPSDKILVLVMNRNQSLSWRKKINLKLSNKIVRTSFFGFIQEEISLFYPLILKECKGIKEYSIRPVFLTFEVSQYLLTKLIAQRRNFNGAFYTLISKDSKIAIDISSNMVKAASSALPSSQIGARLYNALEIKNDERKAIFETADRIIADYKSRCLECGVLDFAMAIELYNNILLKNEEYRKSLYERVQYLLIDNLEEAVPAEVDLVEQMIPNLKGYLLAYNPECGYGSIFGANKEYVEEKIVNKNKGNIEKLNEKSKICDNSMYEFSEAIYEDILGNTAKNRTTSVNIKRFSEVQLRADMLDNVSNYVSELISRGYEAKDIALISTFADPVTEYVLESSLSKKNIDIINIARKNRFIDNKFVHALVTLGYLCHPDEDIVPNKDDVKALVMMILDMDPVRASILAGIICNQNPFAEFPQINDEIVERIGYANISKYEFIRNWINSYRKSEAIDMNKFFQKVFVEVLLVYGANEKDITNIKSLIDSAKTFIDSVRRFNTIDVNKEFLKMIKNDVKSAESIFEMEEKEEMQGVILATPMTYLANSLESKVIVLIGLSSNHWVPRCVKEMSNPYVLTKTWKDNEIYSEEIEEKNQKKSMAIILRALLRRCKDEFVTFESRYSADGYENDGILPEIFAKVI